MVVVDLADGTVLLVHHNATGMWLGQLELFGLTGGAR
jgi:hypothetical protein